MLEKKIGKPLVISMIDQRYICIGIMRSGETLFEINHHSVFVKINQEVGELHILFTLR